MTGFSNDLQKIAHNDPAFKHLEPSERISDAGVQSLAAALVNNSSLLRIDLWDQEISDVNLGDLTKTLETHKKLSSLNLGKNQITELGASYIGELIEKNSVLISLILKKNPFGSEGAKAIAKGLKVNSQLSSLHLENTEIDDHGARALFEALEENTALSFFDLSNNKISNQSVPYIIRMLGKNSTLSSLYLKGNSISQENLIEIELLLNRNQKIYNIAQRAIEAIKRLPVNMPDWEKEGAFDHFNEVLKLKEQAQFEIETIFPESKLVSKIEEVWAGKQIAIMLANPQNLQLSAIIELFDSLNPKQKQYPKNQEWLESLIFQYFSSIQPNSEYTYKKLLHYILQTSISADVQQLMDLCVFHHFNPEVKYILKPEPIQLVCSLINNRETLKTLQQEIPNIEKLILNIVSRFYAEEHSTKEVEINTQVIGMLLELPHKDLEKNTEQNAALLRSFNLFFCGNPNAANSFYALWNYLSPENTLSPKNLATEAVAKKFLIKKYNKTVLQTSPNHYQSRFFIQQDVGQLKKHDAGIKEEQNVEQVPEQNVEQVPEQNDEQVPEQNDEQMEENFASMKLN